MCLAGCGHSGEQTPAAEFLKKTYTYKIVGDLEIQADVYRADDRAIRPVLVWIHGGALVNGSREDVPRHLRDLAREEGYALISIDYRLAPQVKLPAIIEDVQDAFRWIRKEGPGRLRVNPDKLVVAGGSAGGYLTMMTGICVEPRPTALVAYWGYGDVDGDWYTKPSPHYRSVMPLISKEEALAGIGNRVVAGAANNTPDRKARGLYYRWLRQNGLWTKEVTGFDPATQRDELTRYCPVRNITPDYPPILMIHGEKDSDVPFEKSTEMARALKRHNVPHELIAVPNADHGLAGAAPDFVTNAQSRAKAFIRKHLE